MSTLTGRPTVSGANTVGLGDARQLNPLRDEPAAQDCQLVRRFGLVGLVWCCVREALARWLT